MNPSNEHKARGSFWKRALGVLFLFPAWFAPHTKLRIFFHRLRGVKIGKGCEIGYFVIMGNVHPEMIIIEDGAVITARSTLLEHDNAYYYTGRGEVKSQPVVIRKKAFLGIGCVVLPGVTVGSNAIVGAMSLIRNDVPDNSIAFGVPAVVRQ
jgi:acetyltransferase-like isoleucine patch superfamily enzyme